MSLHVTKFARSFEFSSHLISQHLAPSSFYYTSVQFSHSVVSDSLWPHEPQHARPPCPSPTPGVHPKLCPLSWWCYLTILFSTTLFIFCLQSFPTSGSFPMSWLFDQVAKVLEFQLQHPSFQWIPRTEGRGRAQPLKEWQRHRTWRKLARTN